ncbi:hypothetical protein G3A_07105 [Bacillus sp. 17376]|nr:hypothetical protein G3A_07105 [Bacillus sp. 17376]
MMPALFYAGGPIRRKPAYLLANHCECKFYFPGVKRKPRRRNLPHQKFRIRGFNATLFGKTGRRGDPSMKEYKIEKATIFVESALLDMSEEDAKKWVEEEMAKGNPLLKKIDPSC